MSLQLYLWAIQGYRITSTISQPAIPSPVHTQGSPVTCDTDVFQRTFATRNHISVVFVTFVRHDGFVILDANPLIHCTHLQSGYTSVVGAWGQGIEPQSCSKRQKLLKSCRAQSGQEQSRQLRI